MVSAQIFHTSIYTNFHLIVSFKNLDLLPSWESLITHIFLFQFIYIYVCVWIISVTLIKTQKIASASGVNLKRFTSWFHNEDLLNVCSDGSYAQGLGAQQGLCLKLLISGIRQDGLSAPLRKACCNSSKALALCEGSRTNIMSRKPCNLGDTCNINKKL